MAHDLVSIIIPIYNVEAHVAATLNSALAQTYADIEYILVDDRGSDGSMDVVRGVVEQSPRKDSVHIIMQERNSGAAEARNVGIKAARGKYIYFMDADDLITPQCIQTLYDAIASAGADVAVANIELVGQKSIHVKTFDSTLDGKQALRHFFEGTLLPSPCNKLIARSLMEAHQLTFESGLLHEDILWAYRLYSATTTFVPVADVTYQYIVRNDSSSRALNSKKRIDSLIHILDVVKQDYTGGKIPAHVTASFMRFFNSWRFTTALLLLFYAGTGQEANMQYKHIQALAITGARGLKGRLLRLPFLCFKALLKPPYQLYKTLQ